MNNIAYLLTLHSVDGLGPIRLKALVDYFKDPMLAWEAKPSQLKEVGIPQPVIDRLTDARKKLDPPSYMEGIAKSGIKWTTIFNEDYPYLLRQIYDPPVVLYYKGDISPRDNNALGVVGTRKMTDYGRLVTEKFVEKLVSASLTVVSGLAYGVDTQAHQASLRQGGRTIAVLGGGLNKIYPPANTGLVREIICGHGAVVSELPPYYPPLAGNFPVRNRIISGLSLGVLVVEAAEDSGSLITARLALDQGREVFSVPGPVTSPLSKGPIDLIRQGARAVYEPEEILEELGINSPRIPPVTFSDLTSDEQQILSVLAGEPMHIDQICRSLNLSISSGSSILLKMEIKGIVRNLGGGVYSKP